MSTVVHPVPHDKSNNASRSLCTLTVITAWRGVAHVRQQPPLRALISRCRRPTMLDF